jgi:DNA polymerase-3 subunit delta
MTKRDLEAVLAEARKGTPPSMILIHGDDFQVHGATKAILEVLVPEEKRAFNLEQFDGRSADWAEIEASLKTPPFFPGTKAIVVDNAPYFLSREQKKDLGEKTLELWQEGKKEEAARLFQDLLRLGGWTQETWDRLDRPPSAAEVAELFGAQGKEARDAAAEIAEFSRTRGINLRQGGDEGQKLMGLIDQGVPPWCILLIIAPNVDRRTRLYKSFEAKGWVLDLALEKERSGRISREILGEFLDRRLREVGKKIEPQAREMIQARAGEELWAVHQELEKLFLYVGEQLLIRAQDVEEVFLDQGEAWVFDLTEAIAGRDALRALECLGSLLSQGEHPLRLLGTIASEVRRLLSARTLIEGEMRHRWKSHMSSSNFQRLILQGGEPLLTRTPGGDYMSFQKAERFKTHELLRYLELIYKTDMQLKSTGGAPRLLMERLILEMCRATGNKATAHEGKQQNGE